MGKPYCGPRDNAPSDAKFGELLSVNNQADQRVIFIPPEQDPGEIFLTLDQADMHIAITVSARSRATLFIEHSSHNNACAIEVFLHEESSLHCVYLVPATIEQVHIQHKSHLESGAHLHWQNITLSQKATHSMESIVNGHDAKSDIDWIFYARGSERYALSATNTFEAENGGGEITMQGVAEQTAHVGCNGLINIGLGGKGTDTYLTESVLMLDPTAKIDAIPGLEIKTNDVKASHSATVSRVTAEDLYYFAARGIPEEEARQMFIIGFLSGSIEHTAPDMREKIESALHAKYSPASIA